MIVKYGKARHLCLEEKSSNSLIVRYVMPIGMPCPCVAWIRI
jgi:hypothetical protein